MLVEKAENALGKYNDMKAIAGALSTQVDTAKNIAFNSFSVPRLGIEPELIASVSVATPENGIIGPIEGNNWVFVAKVVKNIAAPETEDYEKQRSQLTTNFQNRVNYELMEALIKSADLKDNRSKFF